MFKDEYKAAFSKVTASQDTYRRVMQMTNENKKRRPASFISKALIAAVIVSLLAVTASAAEKMEAYFYQFFAKNTQLEVSDDQMQYIEDHTYTISTAPSTETEKEGYTLTVDSVLADENDAYIQMTLTAPTGVALDADDYCFHDGWLNRGDRNLSLLDASGLMEDADPTDNSVRLFCAFRLRNVRNATFADGLPVTLVLSQLEEIRTGEENRAVLSDETWEMELTFQADNGTREVISEPILCQMEAYRSEEMPLEAVEAKITSLKLESLGAELQYEAPEGQTHPIEMFYMIGVWVGMENGEEVQLVQRNTDREEGRIGYSASAPILLEKVAYVLLSDGTKILMSD